MKRIEFGHSLAFAFGARGKALQDSCRVMTCSRVSLVGGFPEFFEPWMICTEPERQPCGWRAWCTSGELLMAVFSMPKMQTEGWLRPLPRFHFRYGPVTQTQQVPVWGNQPPFRLVRETENYHVLGSPYPNLAQSKRHWFLLRVSPFRCFVTDPVVLGFVTCLLNGAW